MIAPRKQICEGCKEVYYAGCITNGMFGYCDDCNDKYFKHPYGHAKMKPFVVVANSKEDLPKVEESLRKIGFNVFEVLQNLQASLVVSLNS